MRTPLVGQPVPRKEGRAKVTGQARYVDDMRLPGMLHGVTVRSAGPRGRITAIHYDSSIPWEDFVVVTAADLPGPNRVALIEDDQPYLAGGLVNHAEEPVVLLAHRDRHLLEEARRAVRIDLDPLPGVFDIDAALEASTIVWGDDNIFKTYEVTCGDVGAAWAGAHAIVEDIYETGAQEQLYIEPQGMVALADRESGVTVWGSMQCPYYIHRALRELFGLPADRVRVVQMETGGGFGGKEEYPTILAAHAALLSWKAERPVKMIYDRAEDMAATTKRHPSRTRHRTAIDENGRLLAMDVDFLIDGGAYCTLSPVVLSRGTIHAAGPYFCPNVRVRGRAVATTMPPHGAFRGFGAPQSLFALERHMNKVARAAGLAPEEFRRRNFIQPGQPSAVGQIIKDRIDMAALMDRALALANYSSHRSKAGGESRKADGQRPKAEGESQKAKRASGIGFAAFMHGAGFTGSGEEELASSVSVEATREGRVRVLTANVEMGQGTNTIFAQIAADALGLEMDDIDIAAPDTAEVPDSGPTVASRTCMVVGRLVEIAAGVLKQKLLDLKLLGRAAATRAEFAAACRRHLAERGPLRASARYQAPPGIRWDDRLYRGDAYGAYAWAVYVAAVTVDLVTYEVRVDDFVAVQEVGRVINPVLATGQIEGGVAQAIGYTLYERVAWREGRMANAQMTNYIMPTSVDLPPIRVFFEESPYDHGPGGAKGIGELPMDGAAPAIANAIEDALGVSIDRIPILPEDICAAVERARG